jgi:serine/threonine-protein kinase
MFLDEARLAGSVRHPNVASVLDVGEDAQGPYLIMDYVDGLPVARLVAAAGADAEPLPVQLCARIVLEAARGLHAAHEARAPDGRPLALVHRDVSPQNILVAFDGSVRVTDFGIAKAYGNTVRTSTGVLKGNLGYLSPEQLRFEEPDRRSDLFSLGVVLYELLAGRRLYAGKDGLEGARRILNEPPPDVANLRRDVPAALVELHFELMAKDRRHRPATAHDAVSRLEAILAGLIEAEGPLDLGEHMRRRFGGEQRERADALEAEVRRALAALEAAGAGAGAGTRRPRRRGRAIVAAAVALGITGAGAAAGLRALRAPAGEAPGAGPRRLWAGGWHTCGRQGADLTC